MASGNRSPGAAHPGQDRPESSKSGLEDPICPRRQSSAARTTHRNGFQEIGSAPESRPEVARPPKVTLRRPGDPGVGATMRSITWRTASSPSNRRSATLSIRAPGSISGYRDGSKQGELAAHELHAIGAPGVDEPLPTTVSQRTARRRARTTVRHPRDEDRARSRAAGAGLRSRRGGTP